MEIVICVLQLLSGIIFYLLIGCIYTFIKFRSVRQEIYNWPLSLNIDIAKKVGQYIASRRQPTIHSE